MGTLTHAGLQHHLTATALSVVQVALTLLIVLVTAVLLVPLIRARALMAAAGADRVHDAADFAD